PSRYRDVTSVRQRHHPQRVFESLRRSHVSRHYRDSSNVELRRIERQYQSHGIVRARIGVKNDFLGSCRGGHRRYQREKEQGRNAHNSPIPRFEVSQNLSLRSRDEPSLETEIVSRANSDRLRAWFWVIFYL